MTAAAPAPSLLRRLLVLATCCAAAILVAPPATSAPPDHVAFPVEISYEIPELTDLCGVEVWFHMEGTFKGTLFRDRSGEINGEFDSQPNTWQWLYSPETGLAMPKNSFSTTFHNKYPDGSEPGDRVVSTVTGYLEKIPGLPARAGRTIFPDGEILFLDDGVPITDYGEPASDTPGIYKYDFDEADATVCAVLRGD